MTALSCKANRIDANRNTNIYSLLALVSIYPEGRPGRPNSEGGITFVTFFDDKEGTVDVQYTINNCESQDILPTWISSATLTPPAPPRSPDEPTRPSILSIAHNDGGHILILMVTPHKDHASEGCCKAPRILQLGSSWPLTSSNV